MDDIAEKMPKFGQPPLFSTVIMSTRALLLAIVLSAGTLPAFADGEFDKLITAADRQRMEKYDETRRQRWPRRRPAARPAIWRRWTRW